jgi:hypothetical protein
MASSSVRRNSGRSVGARASSAQAFEQRHRGGRRLFLVGADEEQKHLAGAAGAAAASTRGSAVGSPPSRHTRVHAANCDSACGEQPSGNDLSARIVRT